MRRTEGRMHNGYSDKACWGGQFRHLLGNGTLATKMRKSSLCQMRLFTSNHHQARTSQYFQSKLSLLHKTLNRNRLSPSYNKLSQIKMRRLHLQNPQANPQVNLKATLHHVFPPPTNHSQLPPPAPTLSPPPSPTDEPRSPAVCPT
jgi:hypothetical protein